MLITALLGVVVTESSNAARSAPVRQTASVQAPAKTYVNQKVTLVGRFTPVRKGRPVQLQVKEGRRWVVVAKGKQDKRGLARFAMAAKHKGKVKVRTQALRHKGLPGVTSRARTIRVARDRIAIAEAFHALTPAEARLASYDLKTGRLTFDRRATRAITNLAKGDLLAIPPAATIPSGALVEVRQVKRTSRGISAATRSASLPDVVKNIPDDQTTFAPTELAPPEILWTAPGVRAQVLPQAPRTGSPRLETYEGSKIAISFSAEQPSTDGTTVEFAGTLEVTPLAQVELDVDWGDVKSYKLGVGAGLNAEADLTVKATVAQEFPLTRFSSTRLVMVGWLPVWFETTSDLVLSVSATGKVGVRLAVGGSMIVGVAGDEDWDSGLTPDPYMESPEADLDVDFGGLASFDVAAGPKNTAQLSLYSIAGPYVSESVQGVFEAEYFDGDVDCSTFMRVGTEFGLATTDFFEKLVGESYSKEVEAWDVELGARELICPFVSTPTPTGTESPTPTPTPTVTPTPDPDPLRVLSSFLPRAYQYDPYGSMLVASEPDGTWTVVAGALPDGLSLSSDGYISGAPTGAPGTSIFTVHVETDAGREATRQLQIMVDPVATWSSIDISSSWLGMSCGLGTAGQASCWWSPLFFNPEHGDGSNYRYFEHATIDGPFQSIDGSCGLRTDGGATCWTNARYTWDFNETIDIHHVGGSWRQVVGDSELGCGVRTDHTASCWTIPEDGFAAGGELPGEWASVSLQDGSVVCGVRLDGTGACFPQGLEGPAVEVGGAWAASREGSCGLGADGTASCLPSDGSPLEPWEGMEGQWLELSQSGCGIRPSGDLECVDSYGVDGVFEGPWQSISGSCAIKTDHSGWCWGLNDMGQVGNGTRDDAEAPYQLPGLWQSLVSQDPVTCGLQLDDTGWCWGRSYEEYRDWRPPVRLVPTRVQSGP